MRLSLLLFTLCYLLLESWCCEPDQYQNGCKIFGNICKCSYGCRHEYIYSTRRECSNALRALQAQTVPPTPLRSYNTAPPTPVRWPNPVQRSYNTAPPTPNRWPNTPPPTPLRTHNICDSLPCLRGYCLQTSNDPGFTCKCDSTGFYGLRCEKACPTNPINGRIFPHECIII